MTQVHRTSAGHQSYTIQQKLFPHLSRGDQGRFFERAFPKQCVCLESEAQGIRVMINTRLNK
jgi:hypothetical protein